MNLRADLIPYVKAHPILILSKTNPGFRIAFAFVAIALTVALAPSSADEPQPIKITTKRSDDKTEIKVVGDAATIAIRSPSGISSALIERTDKTWPSKLVLQLHLKGLENLSLTNTKFTLHSSISSSDRKQRLWKDKDELTPLDSRSPHWFEVKMLGRDRKPTTEIPLQDGSFEFQLPKTLFENNPQSLTISWIDFYR